MNQFFLIYRIKFLVWQKKKYSNERLKLLGSINNIMNRINECFEKNIINQYYFSSYLTTLEDIHNNYKTISKITFQNLNRNRVLINGIYNKLIELSKKTGMMNISSITSLNFCLDVKDLEIEDKNIVEFVDLVFNPFSYSIYDMDYQTNTKPISNDNQVIVYNSNEKNKFITNDWNNIMKLKNIMFTKLSRKNSLIESINGTRVYICVTIKSKKYALVVDGYFKNDALNISRYNGFIFEKQQKLIQLCETLEISSSFKYGFIEQLSIRDLLMYEVNDLLIKLKSAFEIINEFKKKTISQTVKEFLNKSLEEQRDLITYFLLCDEDNEMQYFAFLLYDLINNESYLLKAQPLADQIFYSLHWSIQKYFKNTVEQVEEYSKKLMNLNEESFSYEKRICLLKTTDSVKAKAMEKLKEINNKNSENCSKAQQYLDNLLKIPFGIYRKESALTALETFKTELSNFILVSLNRVTGLDRTNIQHDNCLVTKINELENAFRKVEKLAWTYDMVYLTLDKIESQITNIIDHYKKVNELEIEKSMTKFSKSCYFMINKISQKINSHQFKKCDLVLLIDKINEFNSAEAEAIPETAPETESLKNLTDTSTSTSTTNATSTSTDINTSTSTDTYEKLRRWGNKNILIDIIIKFCASIKVTQPKYKFILDYLEIDTNTDINSYTETQSLSENSIDNNYNIKMTINSINSDSNDSNNTICAMFEQLNKDFSAIKKTWKTLKLETSKFMLNVDSILDKSIYSQQNAKNEVKRIIAQWVNGESSGYCLGFEGPPGTGKTSLAKYGIAECLKNSDGSSRPFSFIALGGSSNGSTLEGHNYTYVGSTYGKIVDILIESSCMNPIIYIDELDKISNTDNGRELIGILTHLTDSTQNDEFMDKYFSGIPLDLSKVLFIFSYNDFNLLDSILADRIHRVKFDYLKVSEKLHILDHYLLPTMLKTIGFANNSISFTKEAILVIIKNYTHEAGVRKLKEKVLEIVRQINLDCITNCESEYTNKIVDKEYIDDFFKEKAQLQFTKVGPEPRIGLVNGLYATASGVGGITIIEAFKTPHDTKLALVVTGQQGDVMKESITCAKTVAWNLLSNERQKKIMSDIKEGTTQSFGIHIHCPEAATPKDGPSAGGAITIAILSLLSQIPVNNKVAMTGEIDLNGNMHTIGGLELKIDGGKWAGVEKILIPEGNKQDLEIIKLKNSSVLEDIEVVVVKTIHEVVDNLLMEPLN